MNKTFLLFLVILYLAIHIETKKLSRSRSSSSGRGSSKKVSQPAPTSLSYPQASAPKPTLFGWQEKPAQKTNTYSSRQSNPSNTGHSYPSSNTGLSGNQPKKTGNEENIQRSNAPVQQNSQHLPPQTSNQMGQSYPASNGLSGNSGTGQSGYPHGSGLSGSNVAAPAYSGNSGNPGYPQGSGLSGSNVAPPPYGSNGASAYRPPQNNPNNNYGANPPYQHGAPPPYSNVGNNMYHHPQGPPPPYSNFGHNAGYGNHGSYSPQSPGYFGNYMNNGRGYGGVSRGRSALAGVGIAGAGIGTVLTGLALWNLARSTGHHHHTVIYDNRGQPIAVESNNDTAPAVNSILADLTNCTLTISSDNATEVIAIPCSIATSFTPEADVKDPSMNNDTKDNTKCIITVLTKAGREFATTIPCSVLLNTAAENNVTEPPIVNSESGLSTLAPSDQLILADQPLDGQKLTNAQNPNVSDLGLNCTKEVGEVRDPINPCFIVNHNLTVVPLHSMEKP